MAFEQARDVIDHARAFHHQLGERLQRMGDASEKERVQLLLSYLSRHEKHLAQTLEQYELGAPEAVLDTWFQVPPSLLPQAECTPELVLDPDTILEEITGAIVELYECLRELYREAADRADTDAVRGAFTSLAQLMEQEERLLARDIAASEDL